MDQSYWSISSILADAYRLPCSFTIDAPGLSHLQLDPSASASSTSTSNLSVPVPSHPNDPSTSLIKSGTRLELPFWLAELLAAHDLVELRFPKAYSRRVRNALDAEPKSVQLRNLNNWWYAVGARLGGSMEADDLLGILAETYSTRLPRIYSCAQHLSADAGSGSGLSGSGSGGAFGSTDLDISSALGTSSSGGAGGGAADGIGSGAGGATGGVNLSGEMVEFLNGLDESERRLLNAGLDSCRAMKSYLATRR